MKRFKFSLQSVLLVKEKTLEDENIKLSTIAKTLEYQKERLQETMEMLLKYQNDFEKVINTDFNPMIITNQVSYINKIKSEIENQKNTINETEKKLKNQQNKVQQAYIEVKSLENLKEKKELEYKKEVLKIETKELDDIVNSRKQFYKRA